MVNHFQVSRFPFIRSVFTFSRFSLLELLKQRICWTSLFFLDRRGRGREGCGNICPCSPSLNLLNKIYVYYSQNTPFSRPTFFLQFDKTYRQIVWCKRWTGVTVFCKGWGRDPRCLIPCTCFSRISVLISLHFSFGPSPRYFYSTINVEGELLRISSVGDRVPYRIQEVFLKEQLNSLSWSSRVRSDLLKSFL